MSGSIPEGGLTYDDGYAASPTLGPARRVVWKRHARAYTKLRDTIDSHHMRVPCIRGQPEEVLVLPHRLSGWRNALSAQVRTSYPALDGVVKQIERLLAERTTMRTDKTYIPASTCKREPLPKDPAERKVESNRRSGTFMRALRENRRNLDLISKL